MTATATASRRTPAARTRRRRKSRRSWRRKVVAVAAIVLVLSLIAGSLWIVYFSAILVTKRVTIVGTHQLTPAQVSFAVQIPLGVPLARQDVDAIARRATTLPVIDSAKVTRNWPNTITVTVVERRPVLAISQPNGYVLVDKAGLAYQTQSTLPLDVVLADVSPGDKPLLSQVAAVAKALPEKLRGKVSLITADSSDSILLMLTSGRTVTWGSSADSELKAQVVTALLNKKPRSYIDVSSPHNTALR
ncbi:MAG TPA: FtsQ-type POTRA domain-containing protein [Propionibacteriaceae bacterium]|nr:FtsQ-type POTRA domain-containing protein [Propionibacteriaceae bacterium]